MMSPTRISLIALLAGAIVVLPAPAAQAAFGVEQKNFEAGTCVAEGCTYASIEKAISERKPTEAYTQAAGHPPFGLTVFEFNHKKGLLGEEPEGAVKNIRVDIPPGLAANPEALPKCEKKEFEEDKCAADTEVGVDDLTVFSKALDVEVKAPVYNLEPPAGLPLEFGIHAEVPVVANEHVYLKGYVSWHKETKLEARGVPSGDYHEYFEINEVSNENPVLKSKLVFKGTKTGVGAYGDFLTLPSACSSTTTSYLEVESWEGGVSATKAVSPLGVEACGLVPFGPTATLSTEAARSDEPDGIGVQVSEPQKAGAKEINTSDVEAARVTLPEGMTLDPSAAHGLEACTSSEIALDPSEPVPPVTCPAGSKLGTVTVETPDLPLGSLLGSVYLGSPSGAPITEPPFTIYLAAESARYGVSVRLKGSVQPNPVTGRLEAAFTETPALPVSDVIVKFNGGARAPLANPLSCEPGQLEALLTPYTGLAAAASFEPFAASGCPSPLPFALGQGTLDEPATAGAHSSYTLTLAREDGQQYLSQVTTVLPAGLVGEIPSVTPCGEPQAAAGTCGAASQIGTASVTAGAGPEPFSFMGPMYLTGPYNGAPYGLSIALPAAAGPFDLGSGSCDCVLTRAAVNVNPITARVSITSDPLPRIVKGVPIRLRSITITVNRPNFLVNPTSCGPLASESTLTGFTPGSSVNATQTVASPLALGGCSALGFSPAFTAHTSAKTSKADGASLLTTVSQAPGQANIRSVSVQLPAQLVTRLTTLQQACAEATYAANPYSCPAASNVGSATAVTPVLPAPLRGPAYLVSHGNAAFPNLDLLLEGSNVRVILEGNTKISKGVTTSTFASLPDVPISSFALNLPTGPYSLVTANGSLCSAPLVMPTSIVSQSGVQIRRETDISVAGCAVRIIKHKLVRNSLILTVQTYAAGRLRGSGKNLKTVSRRLSKASTTTIKLPLTRRGIAALRHRRTLKIRVVVAFVPAQSGLARSSAAASLRLR
jgi:hypothetical protein